MAITKTVEIIAKTKQAAADIKDLFDDLLKKELKAQEATEDLNKGFDKLGKDTTSTLKNIEKSVYKTEKSTHFLAKGFESVGLALKAAGIGLIISSFLTLREVFTQNQKVADALSSAFETVTIVFNEVTSIVVSVVEKVSKATNGLEGLKNVVSGLITIALTPLKATFYSVGLAISELQLAWEESFFGDDDPETIKKLTKRIESQKDALVEVGESAIKAGEKVSNNIGKAITEVGSIVEATVDGVSKISISSAYETAKANVQLKNTAKLAVAQQARLVEQYDRQAEKLRQIRDNDLSSISDRQKANDELLEVLNKQEKAMLAQAAAQVASAQANFNKNKSIENQVELTNALGNSEGVLAQITGLRSEQNSNQNALIKEQLDLVKSMSQAETDNAINQKLFEAERLKDEEKRLQAEKEAIEFQRQRKLVELEANIEIYKQGTQARLDAEIEYNTQKQELDNQIIAKEDEIAQYKLDKELEKQQLLIDNENLRFDTRREALNEQERLLLEDKTLSEEQRNVIEKQYSDERAKIAKAEKEAKEEQYRSTYDNLQNILAVGGGKLNKVAKALAIADVVRTATKSVSETISSIGVANAKAAAASPLTGGMPFIAINTLKGALTIGATIASSIKSIQAIKGNSTSVSGSSLPSGGGGGGGGTTPTPSFNVVGNTGVNQIAETLGSQQPVKSYVVANDVTTQAALDRNIISNASLG